MRRSAKLGAVVAVAAATTALFALGAPPTASASVVVAGDRGIRHGMLSKRHRYDDGGYGIDGGNDGDSSSSSSGSERDDTTSSSNEVDANDGSSSTNPSSSSSSSSSGQGDSVSSASSGDSTADQSSSSDDEHHHHDSDRSKQKTTEEKSYAATSGQLIPVGKKDPGVYPGITNGATKGWPFMPDITSLANATLDTTSIKVGDHGGTLTHYISNGYNAQTAKRAVIMVHGDDRVSWNMQIYANSALKRAVEGGGIDYSDVVIAAPHLFETIDAGAYPVAQQRSVVPTDGALVWSESDDWGDGSQATFPQDARVGAFEALDALSAFFLNKTAFPAMQNVVVGGFSRGAQLVQRYSVFRADSSDDDRLRFWVSSPGSFVYFNSTRPVAIPSSCSNYNSYKYGFDGVLPAYVQDLNKDVGALANRYVTRTLNFFVGTADYIGGDPRCQADVQGDSHVAKMYNWVTEVMPYLGNSATGKLPANSTVDYVVKVSHDAWDIINSDPGVQRLFLDDYGGNGQNAKAPPSNGVKSGQPSKGDLKKHSNAGSTLRSHDAVLLVTVLMTSFVILSAAV